MSYSNNIPALDGKAKARIDWFNKAVIDVNTRYGLTLSKIASKIGISPTLMYGCYNMTSSVHDFGRVPSEKTIRQFASAFKLELPEYMKAREKARMSIFDAAVEKKDASKKQSMQQDIMTKHIPKIYRMKEVLSVLQISRVTATRLINEGNLKAFKVGSQYRIKEKDLLDFINNGSL